MRGDGDLYDYCVDDPVNMHDPNGLWTRASFTESGVNRDGNGRFAATGGGRVLARTVVKGSGSALPSGDKFVTVAAIVQAGSNEDQLNKFERLLKEYEGYLRPGHNMPDLSDQITPLEKLPFSFSERYRFQQLNRRYEALRKKFGN